MPLEFEGQQPLQRYDSRPISYTRYKKHLSWFIHRQNLLRFLHEYGSSKMFKQISLLQL